MRDLGFGAFCLTVTVATMAFLVGTVVLPVHNIETTRLLVCNGPTTKNGTMVAQVAQIEFVPKGRYFKVISGRETYTYAPGQLETCYTLPDLSAAGVAPNGGTPRTMGN